LALVFDRSKPQQAPKKKIIEEREREREREREIYSRRFVFDIYSRRILLGVHKCTYVRTIVLVHSQDLATNRSI
jgi:hypothetical protein